ncbi:VRR-NUC domain-containing protein [Salmonella enterica subsp. arizonae]|nr:VRR-NUC domain-containing protein [Salmonella enterica subsp. arizonae]
MVTDKGDYLEYYDKSDPDTRTEAPHQVDCYSWVTHHYPRWITWHTKNEGKKTIGEAVKDQQAGVKKGVSDVLILTGFIGCKYAFIAIELKRASKKGTKVSQEQKDFLRRVRECGGFAAVCYGFEQFKLAIADATK